LESYLFAGTFSEKWKPGNIPDVNVHSHQLRLNAAPRHAAPQSREERLRAEAHINGPVIAIPDAASGLPLNYVS